MDKFDFLTLSDYSSGDLTSSMLLQVVDLMLI